MRRGDDGTFSSSSSQTELWRGFIRLEKNPYCPGCCMQEYMMAWIVISYGRLQNNCCCGIFYRRRSRAECNWTNCFTSHFLMLCFYGKCIYNGTGKNPVNFTEIIIMPPCARAIVCFSWKQPPIGALVPRVLLIRVSIKLRICTYFFTTCKAKLFLKKSFLEIQIHDVQRGISWQKSEPFCKVALVALALLLHTSVEWLLKNLRNIAWERAPL